MTTLNSPSEVRSYLPLLPAKIAEAMLRETGKYSCTVGDKHYSFVIKEK